MIWQVIIGAILLEMTLTGLHKHPFMRRLKEALVARAERTGKRNSLLVEFVTCKYCQSWWAGLALANAMLLWFGTWSWDWVWMGPVMAWGANMLHHLRDRLDWKKGFTGT